MRVHQNSRACEFENRKELRGFPGVFQGVLFWAGLFVFKALAHGGFPWPGAPELSTAAAAKPAMSHEGGASLGLAFLVDFENFKPGGRAGLRGLLPFGSQKALFSTCMNRAPGPTRRKKLL